MSTPPDASWYIGFPNPSKKPNTPEWYIGYNGTPAPRRLEKTTNANPSGHPVATSAVIEIASEYPNTQPTQTPIE